MREYDRGGTALHITRVEPFHVNWGKGKSAWVRIWTDTGLYGLGEASPMAYGNASLEIIASAFTPMLIGADPLAQRVLQDRLFHQHIKVGPEGAYAGALAAVDIALWDLKGKALGQPIYQLLGGAWRTELPFYASIGNNGVRTVDEVCHVVEAWMHLEPAQVKIRFDADKTTRDADLAGDIAKARAVRKLVGDGFPLAFDANNGYSVQGAIRVGGYLRSWATCGSKSQCSITTRTVLPKWPPHWISLCPPVSRSIPCRASSASSRPGSTSCSPISSKPVGLLAWLTWRRWRV